MNVKERMDELKEVIEKESEVSADEVLEELEPVAIERYLELINSECSEEKEVETDGLFRNGTISSENKLGDNEELHEFFSLVIRTNDNLTMYHHKDFVFLKDNFQLNKNNFSSEIGYKHTDDKKEVNVIRTKVLEYLDMMMIDENGNEIETVFSNITRETKLDEDSEVIQACIFNFRDNEVYILESDKEYFKGLSYEEVAEEIMISYTRGD